MEWIINFITSSKIVGWPGDLTFCLLLGEISFVQSSDSFSEVSGDSSYPIQLQGILVAIYVVGLML